MTANADHTAEIAWARGPGVVFTDQRYSRGHLWRFDGGVEVLASSAPSSVRLPFSRADAVDPEEALVASVSSCHMLFFLSFAAKDGFVVDSYVDRAAGRLGPIGGGRKAMREIVLRPEIVFSGSRRPDAPALADLHHRAHDACYIANSLKTPVTVSPAEPVFA